MSATTPESDVITLYAIATSRTHLAAIETNLIAIDGDIAPQIDNPIIGSVDLDFLTLCQAQSHLSSLDAERIGLIAGPEAAAAVRGYQASFREMHDTYGLACGPGRDCAGRDALHRSQRAVASAALGHLTVYAARTRSLAVPDLDTYVQALKNRGVALRAPPAVGPASPVPRVRLPLSGEEVTRRARIALGYAFGGLGAVYMLLHKRPSKHGGMIALMHLAVIVERVGSRASSLSRRCPEEYSALAAHAEGISDSLDALFHRFEETIVLRGVAPEAVTPLAQEITPVVARVRDAIWHVEALAPA